MKGGGGRTDGHGKLVVQSIQVGEKASQNYRLETVNAGGHSSIPIRDNAIYELSDALGKVRDHEFPVKMSDTTRAFFAKAGAARGDELGTCDGGAVAEPGRQGGRSNRFQGSQLPQHAAHDLRCDVAGRRPRQQCFAAAGRGERQLPHFSG